MSAWNTSVPFFVTNKTSDGWTFNYSLPMWLALLICALGTLNAVAWGLIGLAAAVKVIL